MASVESIKQDAVVGSVTMPKRQDRRSSREAAIEAADPAKVARIGEMLGEYFSVEEIAAALKLTTRTVLQNLRDGKLKGRKIGGTWRVSANALRRFMEGE